MQAGGHRPASHGGEPISSLPLADHNIASGECYSLGGLPLWLSYRKYTMNIKTSGFINPKRVTLTKEKLEELYNLIAELYLRDARPWVIGYSGGKDSTAVVQAVWHGLARVPEANRTKPVFIIASDTLVETPVIVGHINTSLTRINTAAKEQGLPFTAHKVTPELDETFWVNLIGRGYPAPYSRFRWCTDRMKIKPATKFIYDQIGRFGEVVLALGARRSESATRGQLMKKRAEKSTIGEYLSRHCEIPGAWVFTPIEDWQTEDVWTYLLNVPSPWGNHNRDLVTMYKNAQAGECPLVVDKTTPSCGNSRFGCWTCTVVQQDRSMEAMVDGGEEWLEPMLDFRNWLAATQDPARKREVRDHRRRNGRVQVMDQPDGSQKLVWGPYLPEFRREILRRLLETQVQVNAKSREPLELITRDELIRIRQLWRLEAGDWEDSLPALYREVMGEPLDLPPDDWSGMGTAEKVILHEVAAEHGLAAEMLTRLFDVERQEHGMSRRSQVYNRIDDVLTVDWKSREQTLAELDFVDEDAPEME